MDANQVAVAYAAGMVPFAFVYGMVQDRPIQAMYMFCMFLTLFTLWLNTQLESCFVTVHPM